MRSAEQVRRTPREWIDHATEERRRTLAALLAELRAARSSGAEWYYWIEQGRPALTAAEYERRGGLHARAGRQDDKAVARDAERLTLL